MKKYIMLAFACLSQLWGGIMYTVNLESSKIFEWVDNPGNATVLRQREIQVNSNVSEQQYLIDTSNIIWPDRSKKHYHIFIYAYDYEFRFEDNGDGTYLCQILSLKDGNINSVHSPEQEEVMKLERFAGWLKTQNIQAHDSLRTSLQKAYATPAPTSVSVKPATVSTPANTQQTAGVVPISETQKSKLAKIGFYLSDNNPLAKNIYKDGRLVFKSSDPVIQYELTSNDAQTLTAISRMTNINTQILDQSVTINIQKQNRNQVVVIGSAFGAHDQEQIMPIYYFVSFAYNGKSGLNFDELLAEIKKNKS